MTSVPSVHFPRISKYLESPECFLFLTPVSEVTFWVHKHEELVPVRIVFELRFDLPVSRDVGLDYAPRQLFR
jgi:hypothetical protein